MSSAHVMLALGAATALACQTRVRGVDYAALTPSRAASDEVVAEVEGTPISASQVREQMRAAGTDAQKALATLIDAELLSKAAAARGLLDDLEVMEARRSAEVRRLLKGDFERDTPPEHVPDADFRKLYDRNRALFDHDEVLEVWHLVALVPETATAQERARAKAAMAALRPRAVSAGSNEAFAALATEGGVPIKAEHFSFPRHGVVEEPFAAAAFSLAGPGATSDVVETRYGYHLIRLVERTPARHTDYAAARPELGEGALAVFRRRELDRWMRELVEKTHVEVFPERLRDEVGP